MTETAGSMPFHNSTLIDSTMRKTNNSLQKRIEAKDMFPQLHQKTFYKAALEYSIGHVEKPLDSPIKDTDEFIEKQVLKASEAAAKKNSALIQKAKS